MRTSECGFCAFAFLNDIWYCMSSRMVCRSDFTTWRWGMPHAETTIAGILASPGKFPEKSLSNGQWSDLIKARKASMMAYIKSLGQTELGNVRHMVAPQYPWRRVNDGLGPDTVFSTDPGRLNRSTRGVFIFDKKSYIEHDKNGITHMCIYGFTRSGDWILAHIQHRRSGSEMSGKRMTIRDVSPCELMREMKIDPKRMFTELGRVAKNHAQRRRDLLREAEELERQINIDDHLMQKYLK